MEISESKLAGRIDQFIMTGVVGLVHLLRMCSKDSGSPELAREIREFVSRPVPDLAIMLPNKDGVLFEPHTKDDWNSVSFDHWPIIENDLDTFIGNQYREAIDLLTPWIERGVLNRERVLEFVPEKYEKYVVNDAKKITH